MTQEALKLALEFVESINLGSRGASVEQQRQVITAIEKALAQPERDYERGFIDGMQKQMQSSVDKAVNRMAQTQEPVAWAERVAWNKKVRDGADELLAEAGFQPDSSIRNVLNFLNFDAPPQRTWVGLTDEDKCKPDLGKWVEISDEWMDGYTAGLEYGEAKLKEKNT